MSKHTGIFVGDPTDEDQAMTTLRYCDKQAPAVSDRIRELIIQGKKPSDVVLALENEGIITVIREHEASADEEIYFEQEYERYLREYGR